MLYEAFTDIELIQSFNCQAYSVALYKSLLKRNQDFEEIKDPNKFKKIFPTNLIFIQDQIFKTLKTSYNTSISRAGLNSSNLPTPARWKNDMVDQQLKERK